jgi:hypothetical protein
LIVLLVNAITGDSLFRESERGLRFRIVCLNRHRFGQIDLEAT